MGRMFDEKFNDMHNILGYYRDYMFDIFYITERENEMK